MKLRDWISIGTSNERWTHVVKCGSCGWKIVAETIRHDVISVVDSVALATNTYVSMMHFVRRIYLDFCYILDHKPRRLFLLLGDTIVSIRSVVYLPDGFWWVKGAV